VLFGGKPEKVLHLARSDKIRLILSPFILQESRGVLEKKFGYTEQQAIEVAKLLAELAVIVEPEVRIDIIPNKAADNKIIECAVAGKASFLVTGDSKHLLPLERYEGVEILRPQDLLERLI